MSRIAHESGFRGYPPVWNDPGNETLRETRGTPHILAEGDRIAIPPPALREVRRSTDHKHRFVAEKPALRVNLELLTWDGRHQSLDGAEVLHDGEPAAATIGDGTVESPIGPLTDFCSLRLNEREIVTRIGFLQPVATLAGVRERLNNLGYRAGDSDDPSDRDLRSAIEEFQCDQGLTVDGIPGGGTQRALTKAHGC
ncbi:MAG: peptidoglycan-binding domain-containing protein [Gemmatimonadales bacterium]